MASHTHLVRQDGQRTNMQPKRKRPSPPTAPPIETEAPTAVDQRNSRLPKRARPPPKRRPRNAHSAFGPWPERAMTEESNTVPSNGEVEGPHRSAGPQRRGRTISQRPRRQTRSASRTPPAIVRRRQHQSYRGGKRRRRFGQLSEVETNRLRTKIPLLQGSAAMEQRRGDSLG